VDMSVTAVVSDSGLLKVDTQAIVVASDVCSIESENKIDA